MLIAIKLNDEARAQTGKVGDVATDRRLTPEMQSLRAEQTQPRPEQTLGGRGIATHAACILVRQDPPTRRAYARHPPHEGEGFASPWRTR